MVAHNYKNVDVVAQNVTEEQRLKADRVFMENGINPANAKKVQEAVTSNDALTQELLDNIPGADQLSLEQRRALINQMSLQDVSPAMKAGRNYYEKFTGNGAALNDAQLEQVQEVQEMTLQQLQKKGEMLHGMNPVRAGFNGAIPTMDLERNAAPNHMETPNVLAPAKDGPEQKKR